MPVTRDYDGNLMYVLGDDLAIAISMETQAPEIVLYDIPKDSEGKPTNKPISTSEATNCLRIQFTTQETLSLFVRKAQALAVEAAKIKEGEQHEKDIR